MSADNEYVWLTPAGKQFLEKDYLLPGQTVDERIWIIAQRAEEILEFPGFADKFVYYMKKGWISLSTPIWTNFGTKKKLPISCFGSYIDDTIESILLTQAEMGMMSKFGGGTSAYYGALRRRGAGITDSGQSSGPVTFMRLPDGSIDVISQGKVRRGSFAGYLPFEHPDILEFLDIRDEGNPIQNLSFGMTITNQSMIDMENGDMEKRKIWAKALESRVRKGYPYIIFIDNANDQRPKAYKDQDLKIVASNLCTEIFLPSTPDETFVCDLSSLNMLYRDQWKSTDLVQVVTYFLDAVMTEFIEKARNIMFMDRAVRFAERHRAIGIGWLGWHSYLQSKLIPFESMEAKYLNVEIAKDVQEKATEASRHLAARFGEPEYLKGYGLRNTTLTAIAPTKSSSFILGQASEGIEPHRSNYYIRDLQQGKFTQRNPALESVLIEMGRNTDDVWDSILGNSGSVQHLNFLSQDIKDVFKTFAEIRPMEVIIQASQRQKYIDQGQSLNLMIPANVHPKEINQLYFEAWRLGIKSLYYQYNHNAAQELSRSLMECSSCAS